MWLFTKAGFFSVVLDPASQGMVQVRARREDDFKSLAKFAKVKLGMDLTWSETKGRDYHYRAIMIPAEWEQLAHILTVDLLNYTNFKDSVHGDQLRDSAYLDVWTRMSRYQRDAAARGPWPPKDLSYKYAFVPEKDYRRDDSDWWQPERPPADEPLETCEWCDDMLPAAEMQTMFDGGLACPDCAAELEAGEIDF